MLRSLVRWPTSDAAAPSPFSLSRLVPFPPVSFPPGASFAVSSSSPPANPTLNLGPCRHPRHHPAAHPAARWVQPPAPLHGCRPAAGGLGGCGAGAGVARPPPDRRRRCRRHRSAPVTPGSAPCPQPAAEARRLYRHLYRPCTAVCTARVPPMYRRQCTTLLTRWRRWRLCATLWPPPSPAECTARVRAQMACCRHFRVAAEQQAAPANVAAGAGRRRAWGARAALQWGAPPHNAARGAKWPAHPAPTCAGGAHPCCISTKPHHFSPSHLVTLLRRAPACPLPPPRPPRRLPCTNCTQFSQPPPPPPSRLPGPVAARAGPDPPGGAAHAARGRLNSGEAARLDAGWQERHCRGH
jgi:hypothetical protein